MTPNEQLALWVQGSSIHNLERNECTPDFSCCCRKLKWGTLRRTQFVAASNDARESMLVAALHAAFDEMGGISTADRAILKQAITEL